MGDSIFLANGKRLRYIDKHRGAFASRLEIETKQQGVQDMVFEFMVKKELCNYRQSERAPKSVVVLVTQRLAHGIKYIPNPNGRTEVIHVHSRIQCQRISNNIIPVDIANARSIRILPNAVVPIDKSMVQPEDRIARGCIYIRHDCPDTIMACAMRTTFRAECHISIISLPVTEVDNLGTSADCEFLVAETLQTMALVPLAGPNIESHTGELLQVY
jgi:hypothetical protein